MKTLSFLVATLFAFLSLKAQNQSPIPKISQQMTGYFSYYPTEKVFILTDKSTYRAGETIWFRAFVVNANHQPVSGEGSELSVSLYDKQGKQVVQEIFKLINGLVSGDLIVPNELSKGPIFLVAGTSDRNSPEEISCTTLTIDPQYSNQWIVRTLTKDSISVAGQKNELYLQLQDLSGDIQKNTQLRFQLMNGSEILEKGKLKTDEKGKAVIPFELPAKTNGEPFICKLNDLREEWSKDIFLPSNLDPITIRFYPEGGHLINGTASKIAFTAHNKWGIPVDVEGNIADQDAKSITMVKSFTKGLGLFSVLNDGKQKFKLVLSGKTGQNQSFDLPAPKSDGLAFAVVKSDAEFISANLLFADKQKHAVALTATQGNSLYWAADMDIDGMGRIKIPTVNLPHGINLLSVFSKEGDLLAERIVFTDKKQVLNIRIQAEKTSLKQNESMNIKVRLTGPDNQPVAGDVAIRVTEKSLSDTVNQHIDDFLIFGSELGSPLSLVSAIMKGKISNPALFDVFLIANRPVHFNWEKIRSFNAATARDLNTGYNGISGLVTDKNGTKINKAKVSLVNNKNMQLYTTTTNINGVFTFPNLNTANADDFTAKATDPEGKRELKLVLAQNPEARISGFLSSKARIYSLLSQDNMVDEAFFRNNPDLFQKAPKLVKSNTIALDNQRKLLSTSTNILDVIKTIKPYKIMNNQIVFIGSENSLNYQGGALLVLDGQQMGTDISAISSISPMEIDHINVSTNPMDIQRYTGLNSVGVIEIVQKKAQAPEPEAKKERTNRYDGLYRIPNVFNDESPNPKRDNRTTLLWIPEQKTDENGLIEFSVTASKLISGFVIDVQGISSSGSPGSGNTEISVIK